MGEGEGEGKKFREYKQFEFHEAKKRKFTEKLDFRFNFFLDANFYTIKVFVLEFCKMEADKKEEKWGGGGKRIKLNAIIWTRMICFLSVIRHDRWNQIEGHKLI